MFGQASRVLVTVRNTVLRLTLVVVLLAFPSISFGDTCFSQGTGGWDIAFNAGQGLAGYAGDYGTVFTPSQTCTLDSVDLSMRIGAGTPTDMMSVELWDTSGGVPFTLLETGSDIDPASLTGSYSTVTSTFAGTTVIDSGSQYAIVVHRDGFVGSYDNSNYVVADSLSGSGVMYGSRDSGVTWTVDLDQSSGGYVMTVVGTPASSSPPVVVNATSTPEQLMAMTLLMFTSFFVFGGSIVFALWIFQLLV